MDFKIGQLLKLDGSYYIIDGLTETGRPNKLYNSDKYGKIIGDRKLTNNSKNGWDVTWEIVEPLDPKYAKYENVIAKMQQLDRRFQNRHQIKKDLTRKSVFDIIEEIVAQQYRDGTINHEQS